MPVARAAAGLKWAVWAEWKVLNATELALGLQGRPWPEERAAAASGLAQSAALVQAGGKDKAKVLWLH